MTGGTGSFGRHFIKTVLANHKPKRIAVFSRDEMKQYQMSQETAFVGRSELRYFIGDVRDRDRLVLAMRGVDVVVHAAALKHVPLAEYNPFECIKTNVNGSQNVVEAALLSGVERVLIISTDKAANPVSLYGASKLAAEKIFVSANNLSGASGPRFAAVRYGNVFGSRGSVVPHFKRLVAEGAKSLPITDARMTRFFITLQQGVDLVLTSLGQMRGGEIFVPKIPSIRMTDLAAILAPELPTEVVGRRPGEKLHEVLVSHDESGMALELEDRYVIEPAFSFWQRETYRGNGAKPVPDGFRYTSDNNDHWLTLEDLRLLLQEHDLVAL